MRSWLSCEIVTLDTSMVLLGRTQNGKPRLAFINDLKMQVLDPMGIQSASGAKNAACCFPT